MNDIILKKSNGSDGYYLRTDDSSELLCSSITNGLIRDEASFVLSDRISCFDASIDSKDTLHAVFSDSGGSVTYLRHTSDGKWLKRCIYNAAEDSVGLPVVSVHSCLKNNPYIIYTAEGQRGTAVRIQKISDTEEAHEELAVLSEENKIVFSVADGTDGIFVFHSGTDGSFGYKVFSEKSGRTGEYIKIEDRGRQVHCFYACFSRGKLYMSYKLSGGIYFRTLTADGTLSSAQQLTRRHTDSCSAPILSCGNGGARLLWYDNSYVILSNYDTSAAVWSRLDEKKFGEKDKTVPIKLCCAYSGNVRHNLGYTDEKKLFLFDEPDFFEKRISPQPPTVNPTAAEENDRRRQEIEKKKTEIMEKMGLAQRTLDPSDGFWVTDGEQSSREKIPDKTDYAFIRKELSAIHTELEKIQNELKSIKDTARLNTAKSGKKVILAKVHKK